MPHVTVLWPRAMSMDHMKAQYADPRSHTIDFAVALPLLIVYVMCKTLCVSKYILGLLLQLGSNLLQIGICRLTLRLIATQLNGCPKEVRNNNSRPTNTAAASFTEKGQTGRVKQ